MTLGETSSRKREQLDIILNRDVESHCGNGFEHYSLEHNALPEVNLSDVSLLTSFLGRDLRLPFLIEAMTGGAPGTEVVNRNLALAAERLGVVMCLGSQRAMLEDPSFTYTYQVREAAPTALLFGNIGAIELRRHGAQVAIALAKEVGADGLVVHLNPAQELSQREGDANWHGILDEVSELCAQVDFPVMAKEVGCGISGSVAARLAAAGVAAIDVAGVGGTCWNQVEQLRHPGGARVPAAWGIKTAEALVQCRRAVSLPLVASGGMRTGLDCAKALALGASLVGFALPLLRPAVESAEAVVSTLSVLEEELRAVMFLVGAADLGELREAGTTRAR